LLPASELLVSIFVHSSSFIDLQFVTGGDVTAKQEVTKGQNPSFRVAEGRHCSPERCSGGGVACCAEALPECSRQTIQGGRANDAGGHVDFEVFC